MKRLPAFTLLELLLALILLALLGAMASWVLRDLRMAADGLGKGFARDEELLWFCTAVRNDFERARTIRMEEEGALLCEAAVDTVRYQRIEDGWQRTAGEKIETFKVASESIDFLLDTEPTLIAVWRLRFAPESRLPAMSFRKVYAPADRYPLHDAGAHP